MILGSHPTCAWLGTHWHKEGWTDCKYYSKNWYPWNKIHNIQWVGSPAGFHEAEGWVESLQVNQRVFHGYQFLLLYHTCTPKIAFHWTNWCLKAPDQWRSHSCACLGSWPQRTQPQASLVCLLNNKNHGMWTTYWQIALKKRLNRLFTDGPSLAINSRWIFPDPLNKVYFLFNGSVFNGFNIKCGINAWKACWNKHIVLSMWD